MAQYLDYPTVAEANAANADIYDRVSAVPRSKRTTQHWLPVNVDPSGNGAVLKVTDDLQGPMTSGEIASLKNFVDLPLLLQSFAMVIDLRELIDAAELNSGLINTLFDQMPAAQRAILKDQLVNDPQLEADFFDVVTPGVENKIRDELGPPL